MKQLLKTAIFLIMAFSLLTCSAFKQDENAVTFSDEKIQNQVDELKSAIDDEPNNMALRLQLATVYHDNGESVEALRELEKGFKIDPSAAENKYYYAQTALSLGDKKKAYTAYKDVLQSVNGNQYLDKIAPLFSTPFKITPLINTSADEAFGNFSDDGEWVVYQTNQNGNWDIYEYNIAEQYSNKIIGTEHEEENPDYSPNREKIIYTSTRDDHRDVEYDQKLRDIFLYDINENKEWNLTTNGSNDWRPRYSHDGNYIAFVSERNDLREVPFYQLHGNVFIMEADGRFQLALSDTASNNGSPVIQPGSTEEAGTVYFDSDRSGKYEIYKTDFKGQNTQQITFAPNSNDLGADISPNGDKIIFFSDRDGNFDIFWMNADGSDQQKLTANSADDLNPVFFPDGSKALFHSKRNGNYDLFLIDLSVENSSPAAIDVIRDIDTALLNLN
jgi:Tol biopolymer transport system component